MKKIRYIAGTVIILVFLTIGFFSFIDSKVEYANFSYASNTHRKCQVKGTWLKDKETRYDAANNQFIFHMRDENNHEMKVILDGAEPNNFRMAESIVAKGKVKGDHFHATEVLTKCPSKYEGDSEDLKKSNL
ncbi:MAG: cytochrome c maturation protein CcmE [Ignavibacteria bacterium]|nr:cytochrome c maturation protein CcmE [Ignavibacteria bacterium]